MVSTHLPNPAFRGTANQRPCARCLVPSALRAAAILRHGAFRLFFFSREETRIHVHVAHPDGEAKFWLTPSVALATSVSLSETQIREAQLIVEEHLQEILDAWHRHFGS